MAKRAPVDEKPFRPLDVSVLNSVLQHVPESKGTIPVVAVAAQRRPVDLTAAAGASRQAVSELRVTTLTPALQRLEMERRILFTREETQAIERLVNNLAVRLNTQVKASHVIRALISLLLNAEGEVDKRAGECGVLIRPPNGDFGAMRRFEREIACVLANGIRDAGSPP